MITTTSGRLNRNVPGFLKMLIRGPKFSRSGNSTVEHRLLVFIETPKGASSHESVTRYMSNIVCSNRSGRFCLYGVFLDLTILNQNDQTASGPYVRSDKPWTSERVGDQVSDKLRAEKMSETCWKPVPTKISLLQPHRTDPGQVVWGMEVNSNCIKCLDLFGKQKV